MPRYNERSLVKANCNGVAIELVKFWAVTEPEEDAYFVVYIEDTYDDWGGADELDYDNEEEARAAFQGFVDEYKNKPNWNAQAAYDEAHGTINGEDPGVVAMRELWGS